MLLAQFVLLGRKMWANAALNEAQENPQPLAKSRNSLTWNKLEPIFRKREVKVNDRTFPKTTKFY